MPVSASIPREFPRGAGPLDSGRKGSALISDHPSYMKLALAEAKNARTLGEVPVGAVLIDDGGKILAATHNQSITLCDPSAHAEILALRRAGRELSNYRLLNTTLYVTIEPCMMCMGAIIHARIGTVVFGAADPRWGAAGSLYHFAENLLTNHRPAIIAGVCEAACRRLLQDFFGARRKQNRTSHQASDGVSDDNPGGIPG